MKTAGVFIIILLFFSLPLFSQSPEEADVLYRRASNYYERGYYAEAAEMFQKAADIDVKLGEERRLDLAYDYKLLGYSLQALGETQKALRYFERSLDIFSLYDAALEEVDVLNNMGLLEYYQSDFIRAEQYFSRALQTAEEAGSAEYIPYLNNNLGLVYYAAGGYEAALAYYEEAYRGNRAAGAEDQAAANLGNIASVHFARGRYEEAAAAYEEAGAVFEETGNKQGVIDSRINAAMVLHSWGKNREALDQLIESLAEARKHGLVRSEASTLSLLGSVYYARGSYDKALSAYREAKDIFSSLNAPANAASVLSGMGAVYHAWGRYEEAEARYREALDLAQLLGLPDQQAAGIKALAQTAQARGDYSGAVGQYQKALELSRSLGRPADTAQILDALGSAYFEWGRYGEAEAAYQEALKLHRGIGKSDGVIRSSIHIGGIRQVQGDTEGALELYESALETARRSGGPADTATLLNNIGTLYFNSDDYGKAEGYFLEAIAVKEQLRKTAEGSIRRDFLASWISSYRWLILTYFEDGRFGEVFEAAELIKGRYLNDQLGIDQEKDPVHFADVLFLLPREGALVNYVNIGWHYPLAAYTDTTVTDAVLLDFAEAGSGLDAEHEEEIDTLARIAGRGFTIQQKNGDGGTETQQKGGDGGIQAPAAIGGAENGRIDPGGAEELRRIVSAYRLLLSRPSSAAEAGELMHILGRRLYDLLLRPFEAFFKDKEELIIIPDGILSFLPFEALIMPDGRYLIEKYRLRYVPSVTIARETSRRSYGSGRKDFLGFGGAFYEAAVQGQKDFVSEAEFEVFRDETLADLEDAGRSPYVRLGIREWPEIPATLEEVKEIGLIFDKSLLITGKKASEKTVLEMDKNGSLDDYRIVHFAAHGVAIPRFPELSAIVLSQNGTGQSEDGYLNMREISGLSLAADFVNLSACETGLGKIYDGEGVVGLGQAFLTAGAKNLALSLWQVADESTKEFMVGMYRKLHQGRLGYAQAMAVVKREFIKSGEYSHPFFWAPFIIFGWQ